MEYHIDRRLNLLTTNKYESLYTWAINELDDENKVVGGDQIPWLWTQYFTAIEIVVRDHLTVEEAWLGKEGRLRQSAEIRQTRTIGAVLRPGDTRSDKDLFRRTTYRMFGTDRVLDRFHLDIQALQSEEETELCEAWGMVSYTTSDGIRNQTEADYVGFTLMVKPSTFAIYERRIAEGTVDEMVLSVGKVGGFYSEWSPVVHTPAIKILVPGKDHELEMPAGTAVEVPRLGRVGQVDLYIKAKRQQSKPIANEDPSDEARITQLARPEAASPRVDINPQIIKLLQSLKSSANWIIGLLIALVILTLLKR